MRMVLFDRNGVSLTYPNCPCDEGKRLLRSINPAKILFYRDGMLLKEADTIGAALVFLDRYIAPPEMTMTVIPHVKKKK